VTGKQATYKRPFREKKYKVLAIHKGEFGHNFQVIDGFRFAPFSQGYGFHVDAFGWRLTISLRFRREFWIPRRYNYHIRWRGRNPPWDYVEIHCAILRIECGPAYGGHLAKDETEGLT